MPLFSVLNFLTALSNQWAFVIILPSVIILATLSRALRPFTTGMVFPALLLLLRKSLFFAPILGAFSTPDRIVFWNLASLGFYAILYLCLIFGMLACAVYVSGVRDWDEDSDEGYMLICFLVIIVYAILAAITYFFLPVSGWWCVLSMPVVGVTGALKLLITSPCLLPIVWLGLGIQLGLATCGRGISGRDVNKLLALILLIAAFLDLAFQPINYFYEPLLKSVHVQVTDDFLGVWSNGLQETDSLGLQKNGIDLPVKISAHENLLIAVAPFPWGRCTMLPTVSGLIMGLLFLWLAEYRLQKE